MNNDGYTRGTNQLNHQEKKKRKVVKKRTKPIGRKLLTYALIIAAASLGGRFMGESLGEAMDYDHNRLAQSVPYQGPTEAELEKGKQIYNQILYSKDNLLIVREDVREDYEDLLTIAHNYKGESLITSAKEEYQEYRDQYGTVNYDFLSEEERLDVGATLYPLQNKLLESQRAVWERYLTTLKPNSDEYRIIEERIIELKNEINSVSEDAKILVSIQIENKGKGK
jgi:hypothetical protein